MKIAIERTIRAQVLTEQAERLAADIADLAEPLTMDDSEEALYLNRAHDMLRMAVDALQKARTEVMRRCQPELLTAQLEASVELISRSPERLRRNGERA